MFYYKNCRPFSKTYHGVEFKPGEIKKVFKKIRDDKFIEVPEDVAKKLEAVKHSTKVVEETLKETTSSKVKKSRGRPRKSSKPSIKEKSNFGEESIENKVLEESKEESE